MPLSFSPESAGDPEAEDLMIVQERSDWKAEQKRLLLKVIFPSLVFALVCLPQAACGEASTSTSERTLKGIVALAPHNMWAVGYTEYGSKTHRSEEHTSELQ